MTRLAARLSPEIVAGLLSALVLVGLFGVRPPSSSPGPAGASATPRPSVEPSPSDALPAVAHIWPDAHSELAVHFLSSAQPAPASTRSRHTLKNPIRHPRAIS